MTLVSAMKKNLVLQGFYRHSGIRTCRYKLRDFRHYIFRHASDFFEVVFAETFASVQGYLNGTLRFSSDVIHPGHRSTRFSWKSLHRGHTHENTAKPWIKLVSRSHSMVTYDGLLSLAEVVSYCEENNIEGDFVETGTWKGGALAIMALANLNWGKQRRTIHGFDSFEGLPEPRKDVDPMDWAEEAMKVKKEDCNGNLRPINVLVASEDDVYDVFDKIGYPKQHLRLHRGWFQNTVPADKDNIGKIAVLRLDGDLYDSTMVCLEHLAPKVVKGGFIIIDDWCLEGAQRAVKDYYGKLNQPLPFIHYVDRTVRYIHVWK
jgi:O-methyltransferase